MPFVQRDWKGKITGIFACAQPGAADEHLPEDHQQVVEFLAEHPIPAKMLQPLTLTELNQLAENNKKIEREHHALYNAIWVFNSAFNELELALSALLYSAINTPHSQIAYAIYYTPSGFDARAKIVSSVVQRLALENERLSDLKKIWSSLYKEFNGPRETRNAIAHGMPITLGIRGKNHVRLTSPVFDTVRVGRKIESGDIPGLTASDVEASSRKTKWLRDRIDEVNRLLATFHEEGNPTLADKFDILKKGLAT